MALTNKLTAIADAIRAKTGGSAALSLDDMVTEIGSITGGGSSSGLNDDFRAFVENDDLQLSFTTYTSTGTAIRKNLSRTNITDINMPNLTTIKEQIPINNTIARRLETYALTDISIGSNGVFIGSCDKLELTQAAAASNLWASGLQCHYLASPNLTGANGLQDGGYGRKVWQAQEVGTNAAASYNGGNTKRTKNLIITRTSSVVALGVAATNTNYFNPQMNLYVPNSLLNNYKSATNWSTIADQIHAIEDSYAELGGIFTSLDSKYNWTTRELTLIERLRRQKVRQEWLITFNELITIANDLADNGSSSDYYNYTDCLLINKGMPIANNVYLFITDAFKYVDANGDPIPLSGMLSERDSFYDQYILTVPLQNAEVGLWTLQGNQNFNNANTTNGFYDTTLYHKMNDNDGSLITLLPSSFTDNLVDFMIDDTHTAKLAPPTCTEFGVTPNKDTFDIYSKLNFLTKNGITAITGNRNIWTRSLYNNNSSPFFTLYYQGNSGSNQGSNSTASVIPVFALGKKGVNNA